MCVFVFYKIQDSLIQMTPEMLLKLSKYDCSLKSFETDVSYLLPSDEELESSSSGIYNFDQHCLPTGMLK